MGLVARGAGDQGYRGWALESCGGTLQEACVFGAIPAGGVVQGNDAPWEWLFPLLLF